MLQRRALWTDDTFDLSSFLPFILQEFELKRVCSLMIEILNVHSAGVMVGKVYHRRDKPGDKASG